MAQGRSFVALTSSSTPGEGPGSVLLAAPSIRVESKTAKTQAFKGATTPLIVSVTAGSLACSAFVHSSNHHDIVEDLDMMVRQDG